VKKRYDKYKPSGIEWIGEIPEHWDIEKLRYIGKFTSSGIDKKIKDDEPIVKIINYTDVYGNSSLVLNSDINYMEVSCPEQKRMDHQVIKGDLIFTPSSETIVDIGLSALVDEKLENTAYSYHVLRFRFEKETDHTFKKFLCNNYFVLNQFSANAKGTTRQILNRENFNSTLVILPPKPEQSAIANYLDDKTAEIDTLIEKKKKLIELLKEERTVVINQAVTRGINPNVKLKESGIEWLGQIPEYWEVKKLKYVFQLSRGFDLSSNNFKSGAFPVYGSNGIIGYHNKSTTKGPGITVGRSGSVGEVNYVETDFWAHNTCLYVYKNFDNDLKYIFYFLKVFDLKSLSSGSAVGTLNRNYIHSEIIALPPALEQHQIIQHIETETKRIDSTITNIEKEIELLAEYRTALISEVVTGKIKVI